MVTDYWRKNRSLMLPKIKDWTLPYDEIRFAKDVRKLGYYEWMFMHTSGFKTIYYGVPIIELIVFTSIGLIFYNSYIIISILCLILDVLFGAELIRKIINRKQIKDSNLYDMLMRDV